MMKSGLDNELFKVTIAIIFSIPLRKRKSTPKSSLRWLLTINFFVYVVLLTARSWGSHRILHYEETISVASALSQSFFATLNDVAYGTLVPRILIFLAVQLPLEYLPITLLTIATLLWAIFSTIIFWVVYKKTHIDYLN